jgi:hypothetical protein
MGRFNFETGTIGFIVFRMIFLIDLDVSSEYFVDGSNDPFNGLRIKTIQFRSSLYNKRITSAITENPEGSLLTRSLMPK